MTGGLFLYSLLDIIVVYWLCREIIIQRVKELGKDVETLKEEEVFVKNTIDDLHSEIAQKEKEIPELEVFHSTIF